MTSNDDRAVLNRLAVYVSVLAVGVFLLAAISCGQGARLARLEQRITNLETRPVAQRSEPMLERPSKPRRTPERASRSRQEPVPRTTVGPARRVVRAPVPVRTRAARSVPQGGGTLATVTCYALRGQTADGKGVRPGIVATLDRSIPFGTRVHIAGYGTYTVADRIGHGSQFDIWHPSESWCIQFGRRRLRVVVDR